MTDLLCIGLTTLDIVARPVDRLPDGDGFALLEGIEVVPAGTACGAALVAARLGLSVALSGAVGDDRNGRFVRTELESQGVDTALLRTIAGMPTSTTILPIDTAGRRPILHAFGAALAAGLGPEDRAAACKARFVHWGGVGGPKLDGGPGAELLAQASAAGAIVSCDLITPGPGARDEIKRLLPHVDWFLPSATEALALSGAANLAEASAYFRALGAKGVVIKNGGDGVHALLPTGEHRDFSAHDIVPVDTTSCGDSFCAGFIAALASGRPPHLAIEFAGATAALVALGLGTLGRLENFEKTDAARREMPLKKVVG